MTLDQLKEKALSLPLSPGVYLMRDKLDRVIYVGKAKKLKNRVTQYFQDTGSHSPKTKLMVSKVDHFEVIIAATEFEALVLECSLIKRHMPKYNILLKDDKGFPYIRLTVKEPYPQVSLAAKVQQDGAAYYGPFGSRSVTNSIIEALLRIEKLPVCGKTFPRDIGKDRPCLHYHMGQCEGWCQPDRSHREYLDRIEQIKQLLSGNFKKVADDLRGQMLQASENLEFELAASLRDRLNSLEALGKKQLVTAGRCGDTDVIGYGQTEAKACFAVLHYSGGNLLDKDYQVFSIPDDSESAVAALLKQYYLNRGSAPKMVLLPFPLEENDLITQFLEQQFGGKSELHVPQRGDKMRLVELANRNALEEAQRVTTREEKNAGAVLMLGKMLSLPLPERIESYDISNISGTDMVGSMVVFEAGKPKKSAYKKFKLRDLEGQDDYGAMEQVLSRRFAHYLQKDSGFDVAPDLLLIDGGMNHAAVAERVLFGLGLNIPIFGMVKDDRHRTRALITAEGREIAIDTQQSVFSFICNIQEETHRFAISYHRQLRSKRLRYSQLDQIPGVGPKRKELLLKQFKSLTAIGSATLMELERFLPADAANAVYKYFHPQVEE